jgi:HD-GYP domain-containing protein (c-di-GMP phosphodiesterase class II)
VPTPPARKRRGRILYALLLLLFGVGVAPLVATSVRLVSTGRRILQEDQRTLQHDKARSLSEQVANYLRGLQAQITAIARTLEVEPGDFPMRVARIRQANALERYVGGNLPFNYISVVDTTGTAAYSGIQIPEPAIEQSLQEGFSRAISGKSMLGHPLISASLQEPVMVLSEPVRPGARGSSEEAEVQGAVLVLASLGPLWNMTREMGQAGLFEVYIVDGRGRLVAHSDPKRLERDLDVSSVDIVKQFLVSHGRATTTVPFTLNEPTGPVKMIGTYTRIEDTDWGVIVQIEQAKAYYGATQMGVQSLALIALVALLAAFLGVVFAGRISRPIQELAEGARRVAGGEYATRVRVRSGNEVGDLADAFNHMGGEIQKAIEEIRQAAARNKSLFMGSIRMLANAIDEKDPYTRGHSERVAFYSMLVAKHMGMSPEEVEKVHLSGIIHDVGKIGIEDKILRKPAALTEEEYEVMKQHPRKGEYILDAVPLLKQMAGAGLMHHENWDGSGYPDGLKGEQIPLLGRIVSVADAFDAMTTDRPYSKAMTFEAALARLRFLADKKFDRKCVDAIERAAAAGELTPAKARRASVVARQQDAVAAR